MHLSSPDGEAVARRTRDGIEAEGRRLERRSLVFRGIPVGLRAGAAQSFASELPEPWFTQALMRDGAVLGVVTPTQARLGIACCTALLGLVGRGQARLVRVDRVRWAVRGKERRQAVDRAAGGVEVHAVGDGRAAGLEGVLLRSLRAGGARGWAGIVEDARQAAPDDVPDRWLVLAGAPVDPLAEAWWRAWTVEAPEESARLVQEALVGIGALGG